MQHRREHITLTVELDQAIPSRSRFHSEAATRIPVCFPTSRVFPEGYKGDLRDPAGFRLPTEQQSRGTDDIDLFVPSELVHTLRNLARLVLIGSS